MVSSGAFLPLRNMTFPAIREKPRRAMSHSLVEELTVDRTNAKLRLYWSKKKGKSCLVTHYEEPGYKTRTRWLSLHAPSERLGELLEAFGLEETDITVSFKTALLTGKAAADRAADCA